MQLGKGLLTALISVACVAPAHAQSVAREAGRMAGEFGAGVGDSVAASMAERQPQWITIEPESKEACMAASGGVINPVYMRCRNGRQEYVRFDAQGNKVVLQERPIPVN